VIGLAACGGHRLGARANGHGPRGAGRGAADAVGIAQRKARFVRGARLQIENAAGEHVRRDQVEDVALIHLFTMEPDERQRRAPRGVALLPERDVDPGVAIGITVDVPLEAEIDQRRGLDDEFAGGDRRVGRRRQRLRRAVDAGEADADHECRRP
jgi:hypothetical protein